MILNKPTKTQLIQFYSNSKYEPQFFTQYLAFLDPESSGMPESFISTGADEDGHVLLTGDTYEPADSGIGAVEGTPPDVRVLIKEGTTKEEVLTLLDKIRAWIEKDGLPF